MTSLFALALLLFIIKEVTSQNNAVAQSEQLCKAKVSVTPIQLGRDSYGVVMVDQSSETIWVYEINKGGSSHNRLKLLAARSWKYDKMMDSYNTSEPTPAQVKELIGKMQGLQPNIEQSEQDQDSNQSFEGSNDGNDDDNHVSK